MTRRDALRVIAGGGASLMLARSTHSAMDDNAKLIERKIPSSGEMLPVIGLGTWQAFDVGASSAERQPLEEVLATFVRRGARLVDSSPMYGRAEAVVGEIATKLRLTSDLFLATKVWTTGKAAGVKSMERSFDLMKKVDLMQVHNLVDAPTHLATLRNWKKEGRVRYLGITHYTASAHAEVARVLERELVDFVQINYSLMEREAEQRVLSVAQERGVAVMVNRPLGGGGLFSRVRGKALPDYATEFDCTSWAQFFLKWIVAHPAVTCAIPATAKPQHLLDNLQGGIGRLPNEQLRKRMVETVAAL